jgi:ABC-type hemin transport system ATPase subunit
MDLAAHTDRIVRISDGRVVADDHQSHPMESPREAVNGSGPLSLPIVVSTTPRREAPVALRPGSIA